MCINLLLVPDSLQICCLSSLELLADTTVSWARVRNFHNGQALFNLISISSGQVSYYPQSTFHNLSLKQKPTDRLYGRSTQGCPQDVMSQDLDETETFHFPKLSRPRRDKTFQKRLETTMSQFKNTNWWSQDRDKTEMLNPQDRDIQPSRPRRDRDVPKTSQQCLETEMFKTETTSLDLQNAIQLFS